MLGLMVSNFVNTNWIMFAKRLQVRVNDEEHLPLAELELERV